MDLMSQLRADRWFAGLPFALQTMIVERGRVIQRRDQENIYLAGDGPTGLFAILSGSVQMSHFNASGICGIYYVKQVPSWFGELSELDGGPRVQTATATGDTRLLHLSHDAFRAIVESEPRFWECFAARMAGHARDLFARLEALATRPARVRLAEALLHMDWEARAAIPPRPAPDITQDAIAMMIGATRQTANRILKEFEQQGLISLSYRRVEIADRERIRQLVPVS